MKCKICKTERDDLTGDICVDCLADKLSELFTRHPHRSITMINPTASAHHTVEELKVNMVKLKAEVARLKEDVVMLEVAVIEVIGMKVRDP